MKAGATTGRADAPHPVATHLVRIQWGYWMLYGNYGVQHADHSWDATLTAREGEILRCWLLEFSGYAGPGRESLLPLPEPRWHWQPANANNRMGGVVFELRGGADSLVSFCTAGPSTSASPWSSSRHAKGASLSTWGPATATST